MRLFYTLLLLGLAARAEDWPQFRGPDGQGHSSETNLPSEWSESQNLRWKVPIPGRGWSSPVLEGNRIWLTTATDDGYSLRLLSLDAGSGRILLNVEVFRLSGKIPIHEKNSQASPTPVLDGDRIYVHFGSHGTACVNRSGEVLWRTKLTYYHRHGPGGSPLLYQNRLIISCDGYDIQYVVALDKNTGNICWKKPRAGYQAYTTPLLLRVNGRDQVLSVGAYRAIAYDPETGEEIWSVAYGKGYSNVPRPVFGNGLVFICSGFDQPYLLAVHPDGTGDITETHVAWTAKRGIPLTPSPLLISDALYFVSDNGIMSSLDAKTGVERWRQRVGGTFSASPIYADGRIYFTSEDCDFPVIAPDKAYRSLSTNHLDGRCLASPAVSGGSIYIRSDKYLYRISSTPNLKSAAVRGNR